jgi:nucleotide-binding universal stress UspA family protein
MFHKIVVLYDDSPEADRAFDVAIELTRALQAELRIATVLEPLPNSFSWAVSPLPAEQWIERTRTKHTLHQTAARQKTIAAGVSLDTELVDGDEVDRIIESRKE